MDPGVLWKTMTIRSEAEQLVEQTWKILLALFEKGSSICLFQDIMGLPWSPRPFNMRASQWHQQLLQHPHHVFHWLPWTPMDQDFSQNHWVSPFPLPVIIVLPELCLQIQKPQSYLPLLSLITQLFQHWINIFLLCSCTVKRKTLLFPRTQKTGAQGTLC